MATSSSLQIHCIFLRLAVAVLGTVFVPHDPARSQDEPTSTSVPNSQQPRWVIDGQLKLAEEWTVPAPMNGVLHKLNISEGNIVAQGDILAQWDSELLQADVDAAQAAFEAVVRERDQDVDLRFAQLSAQVRQAEWEKSQAAVRLYEKAVSQVELDRLRLTVEQAKLSAEQAISRQRILDATANEKLAVLEGAKKRAQRSRLESRISGMVVEVLIHAGQWTSEGTPIARIIRLDTLRFESLVPSAAAQHLTLGAPIVFEATQEVVQPKQTYLGRIRFISPEINPVTNQVRIIADVDNSSRHLQPGQLGRIVPK